MVVDEILAGTGHRPDKLGGYEPEAEELLTEYAVYILSSYKPKKVIVGMAMGWDMALAHACVRLGIPFIAAIPFKGQELRWRPAVQKIYHELLSKAIEVVVVCEGGYHPFKMNKRNEWMVDHCTRLLALWNGSPGGTDNCIRYAKKVERNWINVWPGWESFNEGKS